MTPAETGMTPGEAPRRRHALLYAGAAVAAVVAGAGLAWWRTRPAEPVADEALRRFWTLEFETPAGGRLAMRSLQGRPLLVNFWATWCPPCIEEMPLLDGFFRQHHGAGWQVVGLAIDQPSAVRTFLQRSPVSFPIGLAGLEGTELTRSLGNLAGGLPFTVVLTADGRLLQRRMGRLTAAELQAWAGGN